MSKRLDEEYDAIREQLRRAYWDTGRLSTTRKNRIEMLLTRIQEREKGLVFMKDSPR